jgi:hypothetical protein
MHDSTEVSADMHDKQNETLYDICGRHMHAHAREYHPQQCKHADFPDTLIRIAQSLFRSLHKVTPSSRSALEMNAALVKYQYLQPSLYVVYWLPIMLVGMFCVVLLKSAVPHYLCFPQLPKTFPTVCRSKCKL